MAGVVRAFDPKLAAAHPHAVIVKKAPQLELLRKASLMLNGGGLNSIKECLYFGVPMLVFPCTNDQPGNAARVRHHRLGYVGSPDKVRTAEILEMMNKIENDPVVQERVAATQAE